MKYSDFKNIRNFCEDLYSAPAWREVAGNIISGEVDFTVDGVRFINSDDIDQILADELASDEYMLGCFTPWLLADVTGIPSEVFKILQENAAFEAAGKIVVAMDKVQDLAKEYARHDGYGHHFNCYDSREDELKVKDQMFYVFDTRS